VTTPLLHHIRNIQRESPRDIVCVFIPEYVVGRWWENLLHNQRALRLKARLLFAPDVMVANVLYHLASSHRLVTNEPETPPGRPSIEAPATPPPHQADLRLPVDR
jgi:hypothetical protein